MNDLGITVNQDFINFLNECALESSDGDFINLVTSDPLVTSNINNLVTYFDGVSRYNHWKNNDTTTA